MSEAATMTRGEAAKYLGVSIDTLDRLRARGAIPASQVSARIVKYRQQDLDAYLIACRTSPSQKSAPRPTGTSSGSRMDTRSALQLARQIAQRPKRSLLRSAS